MYLHLGDECIIPFGDIVGIFDLDNVTVTKNGRDFLRAAERAGKVRSISENLPRSFVVTVEDGREIVYISPISAATLRARMAKGIGVE